MSHFFRPVREPYYIQRLSLNGPHLEWINMGDLAFMDAGPKIALHAMLESDLVIHNVLIGISHRSVLLRVIARKNLSLPDYVGCLEKVINQNYLLCKPAYLREKLELTLGVRRRDPEVEKVNVWLDLDNLTLITLNLQDAEQLLQILYGPTNRLVM